MELLRTFRKTLTFGGLRIAMEISHRTNGSSTIEAMRLLAKGLTRTMLPLRMRLATNMKAAGLYRPELLNAHFDRATDQMIMLASVFQRGFDKSGCAEKFRFDDSLDLLKQAYAKGKGVINIAPHICGYPV